MSIEVVTFGEAMIRLNPPNFKRLEQASSLELQVGGAACPELPQTDKWYSYFPVHSLR